MGGFSSPRWGALASEGLRWREEEGAMTPSGSAKKLTGGVFGWGGFGTNDWPGPCFRREGEMKSRLHLKPGQRGTKQLVEIYGAALLYVRYRYDEERGVRLKTVELVVEEKPWRPASSRTRDGDLVAVNVAYGENRAACGAEGAGRAVGCDGKGLAHSLRSDS